MQKVFLTLSALCLLTGCSVESESWINNQRAEVRSDVFTDTFETRSMNEGLVHAVGSYYDRFGNGPMDVVVSYDSNSRVNTKAIANQELGRIKRELEKNGVENPRMIVTDIRGSGDVSTTLVTFPAVTAQAPSNCGMMPGYEMTNADIPNSVNVQAPYKYGCTVETLLARQVARPSDLLGKGGFETNSDGRRAERVISSRGYYSDKENKPLKGEKASETK